MLSIVGPCDSYCAVQAAGGALRAGTQRPPAPRTDGLSVVPGAAPVGDRSWWQSSLRRQCLRRAGGWPARSGDRRHAVDGSTAGSAAQAAGALRTAGAEEAGSTAGGGDDVDSGCA